MICSKCNKAETSVMSTEKGHVIQGRFMAFAKMQELVEEWGVCSVYRKRKCLGCGHKFVTIEFARED